MAGYLPIVPASALPPSRQGGPPPSSATPALPRNIRKEVQKEIKNLDSSDEKVLMRAAAALLMLSNLPEAENYLPSAVPRLVMLLNKCQSIHVRRNVCATLTSVMNANISLYLSVANSPSLVAGLLQCLNGQPTGIDEGLQINAAAALSVLVQREEGLKLVQESGADEVLISVLSSCHDARVQEEVVDALCALAAHESLRPVLIDKGLVNKLGKNLGAASAEICVRILLALGMLCGSSPNAQYELAQTDGAIAKLLKLTKSNDHDIQGISVDLLRSFCLNERTCPLIDQITKDVSESS
ncbi:hypothetical protein O6H91_12G090300 [Diphasiastrum complanatum]|uniref:Uncharacterized protein n=1 Tax=Diphasiastrum complanatum TaxID=34168 RepID=A0ACC2C4M7_DIPCM|nr:hypothetical protein O6H91_12G090300 [Diphasiastrum complanatum]